MIETDICPQCGSVMKRGFIIAANRLSWDDHVPSFICMGQVELDFTWMGCAKLAGTRCDACGTIVIPGTKASKGPGAYGHPGGLLLKCPYCGAEYRYTDEAIRTDNTARCQNCNRQFDIERAYVPTLD